MYIQIVGDTTKYQGKLERIGLHLIKVSGLIQHTSGFRLYLDNGVLVGDYSNFVYPYLDPNLGEGVYEYSDNNMSYDDEIIKPDKKEEERQNIISVVTQKHDLREIMYEKPVISAICAVLIFTAVILFGAYGINYDATQFIYNQF